jgi:hypothetical protein
MTSKFVLEDSVLSILFVLFVVLSVGGLAPTLVLTWQASGGWPNVWEVVKSIWKLDESHKWDQLLAVSTVALTMATSLLGLVGFFPLLGAVRHVRSLETASRAELLLNLERQVTNTEMVKAQDYLAQLFSEAKEKIRKEFPDLDHMQMVDKISVECNRALNYMRLYDNKTYHVIFRNCEFFETVGIMVTQGYVDLEDIISRFEVGIERVHTCCDRHLKERRRESWASQLFFKHIGSLFEKVKSCREQRNAPNGLDRGLSHEE